MRDRVLVLNAGSSTLKASVLADGVERAEASVTVLMHGREDAADAVHRALQGITGAGSEPGGVRAVGHRVVHGASRFTQRDAIASIIWSNASDSSPGVMSA